MKEEKVKEFPNETRSIEEWRTTECNSLVMMGVMLQENVTRSAGFRALAVMLDRADVEKLEGKYLNEALKMYEDGYLVCGVCGTMTKGNVWDSENGQNICPDCSMGPVVLIADCVAKYGDDVTVMAALLQSGVKHARGFLRWEDGGVRIHTTGREFMFTAEIEQCFLKEAIDLDAEDHVICSCCGVMTTEAIQDEETHDWVCIDCTNDFVCNECDDNFNKTYDAFFEKADGSILCEACEKERLHKESHELLTWYEVAETFDDNDDEFKEKYEATDVVVAITKNGAHAPHRKIELTGVGGLQEWLETLQADSYHIVDEVIAGGTRFYCEADDEVIYRFTLVEYIDWMIAETQDASRFDITFDVAKED